MNIPPYKEIAAVDFYLMLESSNAGIEGDTELNKEIHDFLDRYEALIEKLTNRKMKDIFLVDFYHTNNESTLQSK